MEVIHVMAGISKPSSGPTYSVGALVEQLCVSKLNARIVANGARPSYWPHSCQYEILGNGTLLAEHLSLSVLTYMKNYLGANVVAHGHGIWRAANLFPLTTGEKKQGYIVWSPHGMMSAWCLNTGKIKKYPYWHLFQKRALEMVDCFHATAMSEYEDIRKCGFKQPVAVIPNGISVVDDLPAVKKNKSVLFLGRIAPVKGVDILLNAWSEIGAIFPDWTLVVAGPLSNQHAADMCELAKKLQIPNIEFVGEVLNEVKQQKFCEASLFVLPSHSENFGIAVAEALSYGVPIITTTKTPWAEVEHKACGWIIEPEVDGLKIAIKNALLLSDSQLNEMGEKGRAWMKSDFSWATIAGQMIHTYQWLAGNAEKPSFVFLD